jgi:hypothetical protein
MQINRLARGLGILAVMATAGCKSLDIVNPNAPDARRALSDPAAIEAVAGGTVRTWFNTFDQAEGNTVLETMADSYTSSWNNWNMNFYSSLDADGTRNTRPYQNDPAAAARTTIEAPWTGYYSALSSSNDVLTAIRINHLVINNPSDTKRSETIAALMQAASLAEIAMNFDKGYYIDETSDISKLTYVNRKILRDSALAKFNAVIALASANTFVTPASWANGNSYTNVQIAQIANSLAARLLAYWPRNAAENATVNWAQVATYASKGISSGAAFNWMFIGDGCAAWCPEIMLWFDAVDTGRLHTRVAHMLDPVTQQTPWPDPNGNQQPNSPDKRLGDGTFGTADMIDGFGNIPKDAGAGTDYMFSTQAIMRPSRGQYHQSNIGHMRYDLSGTQDANGIYGGYGPAPAFTTNENDLLWAEGLIRSGGSLATAANLINNSRVNRGGLSPASAGDGVSGLLTKLWYEQEVELPGIGAVVYYNRRRVDGLVTGTPHEMPVPAKELGVFGQALYTWGGTGPANSPTPP